MANIITGKVWQLDTVANVVSTMPVTIHSITVRFTTAGAGSCRIVTGITSENSSSDERIVDAVCIATSTANAFQLTQTFTFGDQTFRGIKKTLSVNVDTILLVTGVPN